MRIEEVDEILKQHYSEMGVRRWWMRPRPQLGEKTPLAAWEAGQHQEVLRLAKRGKESRSK